MPVRLLWLLLLKGFAKAELARGHGSYMKALLVWSAAGVLLKLGREWGEAKLVGEDDKLVDWKQLYVGRERLCS
jgi:hypothetical protein